MPVNGLPILKVPYFKDKLPMAAIGPAFKA